MPFLPDCLERVVDTFAGADLISEVTDIGPDKATVSRNVEYSVPSEVKTRFGHTVVWSPNEAMTSMANWLYTLGGGSVSELAYYVPGAGVKVVSLADTSVANPPIMAQTTAAGASFAPAGSRIYAAFYNQFGKPDGVAQVYSVAGGADPLFRRPPTDSEVTITTAEPSAGNIVQGVHRIGYYLTTANGYTTKLAPLDHTGGAFKPFTFTASGKKNVTVTFTAAGGYTWPLGAVLHVVMTTSTNLNKYLAVPGATVNVAGTGTSYPVQFDITDEDLAKATDVTLQATVMSQSVGGAPPFGAQQLFLYGERMAYVGLDSAGVPVVYFSEPNSYQSLTAAQHGVYLPGNLPVTMGFSMRGVAYILGDHWTYSTSDNGGVPATWADPQLVDGSIGTRSPYGAFISLAQGFAWVADQGGLYLFSGGVYPSRPVSYYQSPDWQRINWNAPTSVFVIDDKDRKRVSVYAPLDGATHPTHRLRFYYVAGTDPEQIHYSIDDIAAYSMGCASLVEEWSTKQLVEFIGPSFAGPVIRQMVESPTPFYRDGSVPINSIYKLGLLPGQGVERSTIQYHHGDQIRAIGNGHMTMTVSSLDGKKVITPAKSPISLSLNPGLLYMVRYSMSSEDVALQFTNNNELDSWFALSRVSHSYSATWPQR